MTQAAAVGSGVVSRVVTFASPTATGDQVVRDVGFEPKALVLWGGLAALESVGPARMMLGFATEAASACVASCDDDGANPSNAGTRTEAVAALILSDGTPTVEARATLVSLDADGFTLNWSDVPASVRYVHALAIGGDAITNAAAGSFASKGSSGPQAVSTPGMTPSAVLIAGGGATTVPGSAAGSYVTLGFAAAGEPIEQAGMRFGADDAASPTSTGVSYSEAELVRDTLRRAAMASMDAGSFTLSWVLDSSSVQMIYLALEGGDAEVVHGVAPASNGYASVSGGPDYLFASCALAMGADVTAAGDGSGPIVFVGASGSHGESQASSWLASVSGSDPSDTYAQMSVDRMLDFANALGGLAVPRGRASPSLLGPGGALEFNWSQQDGVPRLFSVLALGGRTALTPAFRQAGVVGRNTAGTPWVSRADCKRTARFVFPACAIVGLRVYCDGLGPSSGQASMRGIVTATDGTLLGASGEVVVADAQEPGWVDLPLGLDPGAVNDGGVLVAAGSVDIGVMVGGDGGVLRLYETASGVEFGRFEQATYALGPSSFSREAVGFGADLSIFAVVSSLRDAEAAGDDMLIGRLAWPESQEAFGGGYASPSAPIRATAGWHGTRLDPERGAFMLVHPEGPCADLVGERVEVAFADRGRVRRVYLFVHAASTGVLNDVSLTRRAFLALAPPALTSIGVNVRVVA